MKVEQVQDLEAWDRFVGVSASSVHYHLSGWKSVLEKSYGNRTVYLAASENGAIRGILPLARVRGFYLNPHLTSLPYLSWAGVLAEDPDVVRALIREAGSWGRRVKTRYVELHNTRRVVLSDATSDGHALVTSEDKLAMVLPLKRDPQVVWNGFKAKVRNQVKKAVKSGMRVEVGGVELLAAFYDVYAENMRDLGSPVHSRCFFENIVAEFPADVRLFAIFKGNELVGGALLLTFRDTAEVPWASSKRRFLSDCPNNLLYWEMIQYSCRQGLDYFDFGRSNKDSGTYRFKKQWGSEPRPLFWQYYLPTGQPQPDPSNQGVKARLMVGLWKKLPLAVANVVGPRVRGHISA